jgi:serine/threonine protein phosphatase PrpC
VANDDRFCEACGADLPLPVAPPGPAAAAGAAPAGSGCASCGGAVGVDGYCQQCGIKQPDPHDHEEIDLGWAAGVTDRGLHHPHNEDAMVLEAPRPGLAVVVVCDGVSSSSNAQQGAAAAVQAAGPLLLEGAGGDAKAALAAATAAAQQAIADVPSIGGGDTPSCTLVAAVLHDGELTVGWVGDSRAYWCGAGGNRRLTADDSWAAAQVDAGRLAEDVAEARVEAHSITRWLGADAPDTEPRVVHFHPSGTGRVIVCSDGLWNYASAADRLASQLDALAPDALPLEVAHHLTDFALKSGGHDNVTVVVLAV